MNYPYPFGLYQIHLAPAYLSENPSPSPLRPAPLSQSWESRVD
jgi:hypothetical protein